jgi:hypothetical protein
MKTRLLPGPVRRRRPCLQGEIIKRFLDSIVIVTAPAGHPSANACLELARKLTTSLPGRR